MKESTENLLRKAVRFLFTSGIGFILDFIAYTLLTQLLDFSVLKANFLSSLIGATFVFIVSTHKIFESSNSQVSIYLKYVAYILYQLLLIYLVSLLGEAINTFIIGHISFRLIVRFSKLICKVLITPITMTCNFFVMRYVSEKI